MDSQAVAVLVVAGKVTAIAVAVSVDHPAGAVGAVLHETFRPREGADGGAGVDGNRLAVGDSAVCIADGDRQRVGTRSGVDNGERRVGTRGTGQQAMPRVGKACGVALRQAESERRAVAHVHRAECGVHVTLVEGVHHHLLRHHRDEQRVAGTQRH